MFSDERPAKRLRLAGPPPHTRSIHMNVRLDWSHNGKKQSEEGLLLLDSGATGAVLSSAWLAMPSYHVYVGRLRHLFLMQAGITSLVQVSTIQRQLICQ